MQNLRLLSTALRLPMYLPFILIGFLTLMGIMDSQNFFINTLNNWNDPRRTKWATISGGTYVGIASGYASGQVPERQSAYQPTLMNEPITR